MTKKMIIILTVMAMAVLTIAMSGCTQNTTTPQVTATPAPSVPAGVTALTISGKVGHPLTLTMDDLRKYDSKTISVTGKDNATESYTGVPYNKLLTDAAPTADAKSALMTGLDGYSKSLALANITASQDAIIAINADNTLKAVIPGESKGAWVGNLTTIDIQ